VHFHTLRPDKMSSRSRIGVVGHQGAEEKPHEKEDYLEEEYDDKEDELHSRGHNLFHFEYFKVFEVVVLVGLSWQLHYLFSLLYTTIFGTCTLH
jgi:hypothetical protein